MRENELLAGTAKEHRVLADDVPGTERGEADLPLPGPWPNPCRYAARRRGKPARFRRRARERECGPRRGVLLETVMKLEYVDIEARGERPRCLTGQLSEYGCPEAGVRCHEQRDLLCGGVELGIELGAEAGRAEQQGLACPTARLECAAGCPTVAEIDRHIRCGERRGEIARDEEIRPADAGHLAGIATERETPRRGDRTGDDELRKGRRGTQQRVPHA